MRTEQEQMCLACCRAGRSGCRERFSERDGPNPLRKTLEAVFRDPVSGTIEWAAIELLLIAIGCTLVEGSGSRVRFDKHVEVETFHRPHPAKEAKRYQVRAARGFLIRLGVKP